MPLLEQCRPRLRADDAVRSQTVRGLECLDGGNGVLADDAVHLAAVESRVNQQVLQDFDLRPSAAVPEGEEGACAASGIRRVSVVLGAAGVSAGESGASAA